MPFWYLKRRKNRKTLQFETQLPEAMELLSRSLHAGHTVPSAIELLSLEMVAPLSTEMLIAFEEKRFGIDTADSVHMVGRWTAGLKIFCHGSFNPATNGRQPGRVIEKIGRIIRSRLNFKVKFGL